MLTPQEKKKRLTFQLALHGRLVGIQRIRRREAGKGLTAIKGGGHGGSWCFGCLGGG